MNLPKSIRSKLVKLRSSTFPRVETGLNVKQRLCKFCNVNPPCVETEYNFVFECATYIGLRVSFLNHLLNYYPHFMNLEEAEKWDIIMDNKNVISKTGQYINSATALRNSIVFKMSCNILIVLKYDTTHCATDFSV